MITLKCKMCGGTLQLSENCSVVECEYCETTQTIPKLSDEKITALFDRANLCRSRNEFDKASVIYENILNDVPDESEAYWGLCLCRYGIEYVVDPKTEKRVPTCHRAQFKSILEDKDYLAAIENADMSAREIYISEAEYIDKVQKDILAISSKEEPFDIFICYKETDENGSRTRDSVMAQELYSGLTEQGYKVFFSRITLEDKLGTAYEPYIFAALNSAKIMLVVGSDPKHFNAVWVKNEWSRYLAMIEQGQKKTIIPCYRDIDAYDLPEEFIALQAQNMGKLGAMQDLLRGIDKIFGKSQEQTPKEEKAPSSNIREIAFDDGGLYVGEAIAGKPHGHGRCIYKSGESYEGSWAFGEYSGKGSYTSKDGEHYEGEFESGKFNGQGTYTYSNGDTYTGNWVDGKCEGQGVMTWGDGGSWSGEWENDGALNGSGKFHFDKGVYEGEIKDGQRIGNGTYTWDNGNTYTGNWVDGKREGQGAMTWSDGGSWSGEWKNGDALNGSGKMYYNDGACYEGEIKDGKREGQGVLFWSDGGSYTGSWRDDKREGQGVMTWSDGGSWSGEWKNGNALNGSGKMHYNDGACYEGEIKDGYRIGNGTYTWENGDTYTGSWRDGRRTGQGVMTWVTGDTYTGNWVDGKREGQGVLSWANGGSWTGEWKDNCYWNGSGKHIYSDSYHEGIWQKGKRNGKGKLYLNNGVIWVGTWVDDAFDNGFEIPADGNMKNKVKVKNGQKVQNVGCYVATCVYGSYDCPQVWTLRRFRDYKLSASWFGRLFIKVYYSISPTIVKVFGNQLWFKSFWKHILDKWIDNLNEDGIENTPYQDRNWTR